MSCRSLLHLPQGPQGVKPLSQDRGGLQLPRRSARSPAGLTTSSSPELLVVASSLLPPSSAFSSVLQNTLPAGCAWEAAVALRRAVSIRRLTNSYRQHNSQKWGLVSTRRSWHLSRRCSFPSWLKHHTLLDLGCFPMSFRSKKLCASLSSQCTWHRCTCTPKPPCPTARQAASSLLSTGTENAANMKKPLHSLQDQTAHRANTPCRPSVGERGSIYLP